MTNVDLVFSEWLNPDFFPPSQNEKLVDDAIRNDGLGQIEDGSKGSKGSKGSNRQEQRALSAKPIISAERALSAKPISAERALSAEPISPKIALLRQLAQMPRIQMEFNPRFWRDGMKEYPRPNKIKQI
jgi:hypothetical protein